MVFAACAPSTPRWRSTAGPSARIPPPELLDLALEWGCLISIDTDAHSPGHLEFLSYGCDKAVAHGIDPSRIINTWTADDLADSSWTGRAHLSASVAWLPYVEEDEQAQDQRPAQEGQPRHQAQRRPRLTQPTGGPTGPHRQPRERRSPRAAPFPRPWPDQGNGNGDGVSQNPPATSAPVTSHRTTTRSFTRPSGESRSARSSSPSPVRNRRDP
jgi:hypothetical protein